MNQFSVFRKQQRFLLLTLLTTGVAFGLIFPSWADPPPEVSHSVDDEVGPSPEPDRKPPTQEDFDAKALEKVIQQLQQTELPQSQLDAINDGMEILYGGMVPLPSRDSTYEYDSNGRLNRIIDPGDKGPRFEYDAQDNRIQITDPVGNTTRYEYDGQGNIVKTEHLSSPSNEEPPPNAEDTGSGFFESLPSGGASDLESTGPSVSGSVSTGPDGTMHIKKSDGAPQGGTFDSYIYVNPIISFTAGKTADGYLEQKGVDPSSAAGQVVKPYVVGTTIVDDQFNPDPKALEKVIQQLQQTELPQSQLDAINDGMEILYGGMVPLPSRDSTYEYDSNGRLNRIIDPGDKGPRFEYDAQDNRIQITDPVGNTTRYEYDEVGNIVQTEHFSPPPGEPPPYVPPPDEEPPPNAEDTGSGFFESLPSGGVSDLDSTGPSVSGSISVGGSAGSEVSKTPPAPKSNSIVLDTEAPVISEPFSKPEPFAPNSDLNPGAEDEPLLYSNLIPLPTPDSGDTGQGGAGDSGGEGVDEGGGETPPGGWEPPPLHLLVDHAMPYFRKGALGILSTVGAGISGGAGDSGGDGDEGADEGGDTPAVPAGESPQYVLDEGGGRRRIFEDPNGTDFVAQEPPGGAGDAGGEGADGDQEPPGGAGDAGGDRDDEGGEGSVPPPPNIEIPFSGVTLTVPRTPIRVEPLGGAGDAGGEGADEKGPLPPTGHEPPRVGEDKPQTGTIPIEMIQMDISSSSPLGPIRPQSPPRGTIQIKESDGAPHGGTFDSYFYVNPIISFAAGETLDHTEAKPPAEGEGADEAPAVPAGESPQYVLDEGGGRRRTFEHPNSERFLQRTSPPPNEGATEPPGGAGDAGGDGADEGGGETPPGGPVDQGGSLSPSNVIWIDEPGEPPSPPGGAGDAGGEGADEDKGETGPPEPTPKTDRYIQIIYDAFLLGPFAPSLIPPGGDDGAEGGAGDAGGEGADEGGDGSGGGKGDQKAIDEGMEILYGGLIPLPTPGTQAGGERADEDGGETPEPPEDLLISNLIPLPTPNKPGIAVAPFKVPLDGLGLEEPSPKDLQVEINSGSRTSPPQGPYGVNPQADGGDGADDGGGETPPAGGTTRSPYRDGFPSEGGSLFWNNPNSGPTEIPPPFPVGSASSGGILVYSNDRDERIVGYADGHAAELDIEIPFSGVTLTVPRTPIRVEPLGGAGDAGGEGADEGGDSTESAPSGSLTSDDQVTMTGLPINPPGGDLTAFGNPNEEPPVYFPPAGPPPEPPGGAGDAGGDGDEGEDGTGGGKGDQKAIDEGMEILYGGLIPLPTPNSPGGEAHLPTPDELRKSADALASKDPQMARFLRQQAEALEAMGQQIPQVAPGPTPEEAIDEGMEILYGGMRVLPPTDHEPPRVREGQPGTGTIPTEIIQMDLSSSSPLGPIRLQTPPQGTIQIKKSDGAPHGGTFDSYFYVNPLISFTAGKTLNQTEAKPPAEGEGAPAVPAGESPQYVLDEGGGRRRTFEDPNGTGYVAQEPAGGAGDAGGDGADEGGGETPPRRPVDQGGSLSPSNDVWIDDEAEAPLAGEISVGEEEGQGAAGDAGGEGAKDGAGGEEDVLPPDTSGEVNIFVDHAMPYFRKGALGVLATVGTLTSESPLEPPGGAGDSGGDGDEGADEGGEGSEPTPSDIEIPFSGVTLTVPRTPTGREASGTYRPPVDWKTVGDESGAAGDAGGEGADESGGTGFMQPPPGPSNILWGDYFYVNPLMSFAVGETLVHIEAKPPVEGQDAADSFDYSIDGKAPDTETITIPLDGKVWFVKDESHHPPVSDSDMLKRDLDVDHFFGSGLDTLLPPTAGENVGPNALGGGLGPDGTNNNPALDPQLDTGSAVLNGASSIPLLPNPAVLGGGQQGGGGGGGVNPPQQNPPAPNLDNNFHAQQQAALGVFAANQAAADAASHTQQAADLAAFQGGQNTAHDDLHTQMGDAHTTFHNAFAGNQGFGTKHGQFHAQEGQVHGDLHAQQAVDLNAFQGGQQAAENALHAQQNADLATFQAKQDADHTDFHNPNPNPGA